MPVVLLPAEHRRPQAWRNGGGVTFEIARAPHPQRPQDFLWRVSIAEVAASGAFSKFAGYQRLIAVISGAGMSLRGLGPNDSVLMPFQVTRFDGAVAVEGLLPQGPVQDFNVIFDPTLCRARLAFVDGSGRQPLAARATFLVNVGIRRCDWCCGDQSGHLAQFDALQLAGGNAQPLVWRGEARVALVEIEC